MEDNTMSEDRPEKIKIICKRMDAKGYDKFWKEVQEAMDNGYVYAQPEVFKEMPKMHGIINVTLQDKAYVAAKQESEAVKKKEIEALDAKAAEAEKLAKEKEEEAAKAKQEAESAKVPEKEDPLEVIKGLKKREDLVKYANGLGILVPDEMTNVASVRKYIKEKFENRVDVKPLAEKVKDEQSPDKEDDTSQPTPEVKEQEE